MKDPEPIAQFRCIKNAVIVLRSKKGFLIPGKIAEIFGLDIAELAGLIKGSRSLDDPQTIAKIQPELHQFERIARLLALFSVTEFQHWLRKSNPELDGDSPLSWIMKGRVEMIGDLVSDMLTGRPG